MSINVYWACFESEWMRAKEPFSVSKTFYSSNIANSNYGGTSLNYCPAFNKNLKNLYSVNSLYDYKFTIVDNELKTDMYDQNFFDEHVVVRSIENKFFSFNNKYIFFTDEESLPITAYEFPFLEQNEISKRCIPIPGQYDIGKWFRPLEFPFILKDNFDEFNVGYEDVLYYIRFHTDKKIVFKQFIVNDKIESYLKSSVSIQNYKSKRYLNLDSFYEKFNHKKHILKEIKQNLI